MGVDRSAEIMRIDSNCGKLLSTTMNLYSTEVEEFHNRQIYDNFSINFVFERVRYGKGTTRQ
jgi:hypothetical protein